MADDGLDDRDLLAAELALGLLEGEERAAALRLSLSEPDFARAVEGWRDRLAPLFDDFASMAPPERVWAAIDARIGVDGRGGVVRRMRLWRGAAIAAATAAAGFGGLLLLDWRAPRPDPALRVTVAQLVNAEGSPLATAAYDPRTNILRIRAGALVPAPLAPELWIIPADGVPRSLGLIAGGGVSEVTIAPALRDHIREGATLAITGEVRATAPHAAPSTTPVVIGKISLI